MYAAEFVQRARDAGYKVENHAGYWRMQCCGHGGEECNLDVRDGEKGVLLKCHSRDCPFETICAGLGVNPVELFFEPPKLNGERGTGNVFPYRDEQGKVLYEIRRTEATGTRDKEFKAWLPGQPHSGIGKTPHVLFGIPELLLSAPGEVVCIAEGEKCALAVAHLELRCTTNPFGAGTWRPEYTAWLLKHLPDRRFLVLPDNDEKGKKHALAVCDSLKAAGLKVWLANLGDLPEKADVVQWIARGGTADQLRAMAADAPPSLWPRLLTFAQLLTQPSPSWLIDGLIMEETMVEFYGPPNEGKTFVAVDGCMALRRGGKWCGKQIDQTGSILYISADGGLGFADRARAWALISGQQDTDEEFWTLPEPVNLYRADTTAALRELIAYLPKAPKVLVIDTYSRCIPGVNENQQEFASMVVDNLTALMREFHLSVWLLHHTDKTGLHDRGSSVILGACDTQIRVGKSKENVITLTCEKQRDAPFFDPIYFDLGRVPSTNETWVMWRPDAPPTDRRTKMEQTELAVWAAIAREPGITRGALYLALEQSEKTLRKHVARLIGQGKVVEKNRPREAGKMGPPETGLWRIEGQYDLEVIHT